MSRIDRFKVAQSSPDSGFEAALREIQAGRKTGHWIWYIFPQLAGLGQSPTAREFSLDGEAEAVEYLQDPDLRVRLLAVTSAVANQLRRPGTTLRQLMGSDIDAQKAVSSLTLFQHVARTLAARERSVEYASLETRADEVLSAADAQGYPPCEFTRRSLQR